ncbi:MAG: SirB2 family protein, partial [Gammaproteobacteria bacterium]
SAILQQRWIRIAPHINDTVLLLSAIALVIVTLQYPGPTTWINAKIAALLLYIILGSIALKRGKTKQIRIISGVLALLTFAYIVMVAMSKNPLIVF